MTNPRTGKLTEFQTGETFGKAGPTRQQRVDKIFKAAKGPKAAKAAGGAKAATVAKGAAISTGAGLAIIGGAAALGALAIRRKSKQVNKDIDRISSTIVRRNNAQLKWIKKKQAAKKRAATRRRNKNRKGIPLTKKRLKELQDFVKRTPAD